MKMRATKALTYRTRRLLPGDVFEVERRQDARILKAIRKAEEHVEIEESPMQAGPDPVDDIVAVRAEYEAVAGKRPFFGWGIDTLREKIATYKADAEA